MQARILIVLLMLFPGAASRAQLAQSVTTYPVRGTVVNSITGEPIRGAMVQIYANRQRTVLTGADGAFLFADVPAGTINLNVGKPGFFALQAIQSPNRQATFATAGPDQSPVVVKLVPEAVISGHITGDNGEGVEGLPIQLFAERVENGKKTRSSRTGSITNEDGGFRIAELIPGKYFVFAGPNATPEFEGAPGQQAAVRGYAAAFYPGVAEMAAANPVELAAGQQVEINMSLASQPLHRISGTLSGYSSAKVGVNLQVTNAAGQEMPAGFRFNPHTGVFNTVWLPAGSYTLSAELYDAESQRSSFAAQKVNLVSDVSGVRLHLLPNTSVPVNFRVEATRSDVRPQTQTLVTTSRDGRTIQRQVNAPPARVLLAPVSEGIGQQQQRMSQPVAEDGAALEIPNVPPGAYHVQIYANGAYYVESARCGALNLLEQNLVIAPGSTPEALEIVLRDDFGSLDGSVALAPDEESAAVIAIPQGGRGQ